MIRKKRNRITKGLIKIEGYGIGVGIIIGTWLERVNRVGLSGDWLSIGDFKGSALGAHTVTYTDGKTEDSHAGDIFYWPPGHAVKVNQDAEFVLFSPQHEHTIVFDHINKKLGA